MIVVDTNIVAYLYMQSEFSRSAEALLARDKDWAAPVLWRSEFRNILAGALRRNHLGFDMAQQLLGEAESLLAGCEHDVDSRHVLQLVRESDCSAYDCEFVSLAIQLGSKLVTMDRKLLRAFPNVAVPLIAN
jgi:predicted nucleic acid-binding protein